MNIFHEAKQILDKDGKVNALGPYGKMKLTGSEVASYFRKNKVSDPKVKKAVEVALDLGGAYDVARKEIAKFFGDKILKTKEVQQALRFANEEVFAEGKLGDSIIRKDFPNVWAASARDRNILKKFHAKVDTSNYKKQKDLYRQDIKGFIDSLNEDNLEEDIRDPKWKALLRKHKSHIDNFVKRNKDLPKNVEDDLMKWALDNGEIKTDDPDEFDDFLDRELSEGTMAIGIFDNNPSEKKKAIAGMQKLLKGKRDVKVGSPEGQKIGKELDAKYLSDDELADDFARPSNKNMTIQDLMKKHEKRFNIKFEEKESVMDSYRQMYEAKEFKQSDIDTVAKLTDRNEHTKSLIHIAKSMGDRKSLKKLELIDKMHDEYGQMPMNLKSLRDEIYDDLKKQMKNYSNGDEMYGAT